MALDRQLSRDFWLHEFSGWERASEAQVSRLRETVARVLQPTRSHFGAAVYPTSWLAWSSGELRTGAHAEGGTVDYVVDDGLTRDAHTWAGRFLVPGGYVGRLIYEPERPARPESGVLRQGEHIHVSPVGDMVAAFGPGESDVQVLEERAEGEYVYAALGLGAAGAAVLAGLLFFLLPGGAPGDKLGKHPLAFDRR